jgi:hypothetical protein
MNACMYTYPIPHMVSSDEQICDSVLIIWLVAISNPEFDTFRNDVWVCIICSSSRRDVSSRPITASNPIEAISIHGEESVN